MKRSSTALTLAIALTSALGLISWGCEPTNQDYMPTQPIAYSHAVHAGELQVPCMYCHYSAERGRYAGIPSGQICMNCHTQVLPDHPEIQKIKTSRDSGEPIAWKRVHKVPDHTFFDHSAHVAADVQCQTCHGDVQTMPRVGQFAPLTMGWCLDCHRSQPAGPGDTEVGGAHRLSDCVVCHH